MKKPSIRNAIDEIANLARKRPENDHILNELNSLLVDVRSTSVHVNRAAILVAAGLLEHSLRVALEPQFAAINSDLSRKLFDGDHERDGVIGTIYTRDLMALAFGLYGAETSEDVKRLKALRNYCAHYPGVIDLNRQAVVVLCDFNAVRRMEKEFSPFSLRNGHLEKILIFLEILIPYLLLHTSTDWPKANREGWKEFFV